MAEGASLGSRLSLPTKIEDEDINFRRNSTGKTVASSSGEKAVPHYLRASAGSCHDLCKYGHKNASEEKGKRPIPRKCPAKWTDSHLSLDTVASLGKKKPPNNMTRSLDSGLSFVEGDSRGERKKAPLVKNKVEDSSKPASKLEVSSKKEKRSTSVKPKLVTSKPPTSLESSGGLLNGKRTVTARVASTKVSPKPTLNGVGSLNRKQNGLKRVVSPLRIGNGDIKEVVEPTKAESCEVEEKTLYVINTEPEDNDLGLDQTESFTQEVEAVKSEYGDNLSELDQKDAGVEYIDEMENEDDDSALDQKEAHVQEIEYVENSASESGQNETFEADVLVESLPCQPSSSSSSPHEDEEDLDESEYTISEFTDDTFSDNSEAENTETQDPSHKAHRGNDDEKAWKMKFRRGTVVDIQAEDNASPRRLRFRRGRVLDKQDVGSDGRHRKFKARDDGDDGDDDTKENGSEKVVLKHQDVQEGKKGARTLFNLVIKETASKLVEARKSKVKALVGAFETVISLQDAKSSANSAS